MKKRPKEENRKLILLAVSLSASALLFLTVTAIPTPALAGHNFAADTEPVIVTEAEPGTLLQLPFAGEGRNLSFVDYDWKQDDELEPANNPDPDPEPEPDPDPIRVQETETTKLPAPSGRRSVNTDPTTRPSTTQTNESPTSTQTNESPATTQNRTTARPMPPTQARVQAPATTAPAPAPAPVPATRAPVVTTAPTTAATTRAPAPTTQAPVVTTAPTTTKAPAATVDGSFNRSSCDEFIALLNQYRAGKGVGALQKSGSLTGVAEKRSVEIVSNFSHAGIAKYGNYGENIFMGAGAERYNYASTALDAFKKSAGHDTNQLYAAYNYVGVGHYITPSGAHYWAVIFSF